MKSITQINHTIESHEMGHEWDDVMHKIQKFTAPRNLRNMNNGNGKYERNYQLTRKFHEQCFLLLQSNSGAYEDT